MNACGALGTAISPDPPEKPKTPYRLLFLKAFRLKSVIPYRSPKSEIAPQLVMSDHFW
jgi:hypothetical protein